MTVTTMQAAGYAAMSRENLRELVGGFEYWPLCLVLHAGLGRSLPRGNAVTADVSALLDAAVDGAEALGAERLAALAEQAEQYRRNAAECSRGGDKEGFWYWIDEKAAMVGGHRRLQRLHGFVEALQHARRSREGLCDKACCDPQYWMWKAEQAAVRPVLAEVA